MDDDVGVEALVVGVADDGADVDVLREGSALGDEVEGALGLGVGGEPVLAVDLLVVGGVGRAEVFVAGAGVLGDGDAVDEDDLVVLLIDPDLALEVAVIFDELLGLDVEDVGFEVVDVLLAEVGEVVVGELGRGEDEGEALLDVREVAFGHDDALDGVLRGKGDVLFAAAGFVEADVGDLVVLAVGAVGVVGDGVEFYVLDEGVLVAGSGEGGLLLAHLVDDLGDGDAGGGGGVERAKAFGCLLGEERRCGEERGEEEELWGHGVLLQDRRGW